MGEVKKPNGSEKNLPQPTYVLAPAYYPGYEDQDTVNLADYIRVLWRRRYLIVAGTLACALAALIVSSLMTRMYEAKATLILMPPSFSTELKPAPLSVETYQSILESDYIAQRLRTEAIAKGIIEAKEGLGSLETQIYTGKEKDQPYMPLIDLRVEADDPEKAAAVANTWAETFINESGGLATKGQQGTLQFIRAEYPQSRERLTLAETKLKDSENSSQEKIKVTENLWDTRISEFQAKWNIDALKRQLESIQRELTGTVAPVTPRDLRDMRDKAGERELAAILQSQNPKLSESDQEGLLTRLQKVELEIRHTGDTLAELKKEIQAHPQFLIIAKSISDDALWDKVGKDFSPETAEQLEALKLRTQELNPIYQSLAQRLADTQVAYDALVPQREALRALIDKRQAEAQRLHELILEKELEFDRLDREKMAVLETLERERDYEVGALKREVESAQATYKTLAQKYEAALLAESEQDQDVKVGAFAVPPTGPTKPKVMLNTAIALAVGLMMSVMLAFLIEFVQTSALTEPQQASSQDKKVAPPFEYAEHQIVPAIRRQSGG